MYFGAYFRLLLLICKCYRQGQQFASNLIAQHVKLCARREQQMPRHVSHYQSNHKANACHNHGTAALITTPQTSAMLVAAKQGILNKKLAASFLGCLE